MDAFELYKIYIGIKQHFTSNYNYKLYGPGRAKPETFILRKDRLFFEKLAKKYKQSEIVDFLIANFIINPDSWIGNLVNEESNKNYTEWKARNESLKETFKSDLDILCQYLEKTNLKFNDLFKTQNTQQPLLVKLLLQNIIYPETYSILNHLLNFHDTFDKIMSKDIFWLSVSNKYKKYGSFISIEGNESSYKKIIISAVSVLEPA